MKNIFLFITIQFCFFVNGVQAQFSALNNIPTPKLSVPVCIAESRERADVPDLLTCEGKSYCFKDQSYYGICGRVFCQEKFCNNSQNCKDDNEPQTLACYNKMVAASNSKAKFTERSEIPSGTTK